MKRAVFLLIAALLLTACNLSILDQGIADRVESVTPVENIPKKEIQFSTEAPGNVMATEAYYEDRINISWSAVTGADFYTLERAEVGKLTDSASTYVWTEILDVATGTSFTDRDSSLQSGKYYAYRVTAHTTKGMLSGETSDVCYGSLLAPPAQIDAAKGESFEYITVTWNQMPGVSRYYIYKSDVESSAGLGEYVGVVTQQSSSTVDETDLVNRFDYQVPKDEQGRELFFVIRSSGPLGTMSEQSNARSGYSLVVGAASAPKVESITKGDSVSEIILKWERDPSDTELSPITYTIKRSSLGSAESTIYPLYDGDHLDSDGDLLSKTDTNVVDRTVYTYSIIASNSVGMSPATIVTGYLLSQPEGITFVPDVGNGEYVVESFELPVGGEESGSGWMYDVVIETESGSLQNEGQMTAEELEAYVAKTSISKSGSIPFEQEPRHIRITTVNGNIRSKTYLDAVVGGIPDVPVNAVASRNRSTTEAANSAGVFPIQISWEQRGDYQAYSYKIRRTDNGMQTTTVSASFVDPNVSFATLYTYEIEALDPFGRSSGRIITNEGYGAITGERFKHIFESNILKPWETPDEHPDYISGDKKAIYDKVSKQGMGSLTYDEWISVPGKTVTIGNSNVSGTISYNADTAGVGGLIQFKYTKYFSEADFLFYLAGDASYSMNVSASGSGSVSCPADFETGGLFPASVSFSNLSVSNYAFEGNYVIKQHHENGDVSYTVSSK